MNNEELAAEIAALKAKIAALEAKAKSEPSVEPSRKPWPKIDWTEGMSMGPSAMKPMADLVPDVKKGGGFNAHAWGQTKRGEPGGFGPPRTAGGTGEPAERATGWIEPQRLEPPPGVKYVDQIVDFQDDVDKGENVKRIAAAIIGRRIK